MTDAEDAKRYDLQPIDLARAILGLAEGRNATGPVIEWATEQVRLVDGRTSDA